MARPKTDSAPTPEKPEQKVAQETSEEGAPPNAVLVTRTQDEQGNISVELSALGDVKVAEIVTVLELGKKQARQLLGLDD